MVSIYFPSTELSSANAYSIHMLLSPFRRPRRLCRGWFRLVIILLATTLSVDFIFTIFINAPPTRLPPSATNIPPAYKERIFIASIHWNNEFIIRSHWSNAVLELVKHFGADNIYISIMESGSWDDTKGALRDLDRQLEILGVERSIEMFETTHEDEIARTPGPFEEGWIWTSRSRNELRRIPYLAGIRNKVTEKLLLLAQRTEGHGNRTFDRILWLNDVIFTVFLPLLVLISSVYSVLILIPMLRPKTSLLCLPREMATTLQLVHSTSQNLLYTTIPLLSGISQAQKQLLKPGHSSSQLNLGMP